MARRKTRRALLPGGSKESLAEITASLTVRLYGVPGARTYVADPPGPLRVKDSDTAAPLAGDNGAATVAGLAGETYPVPPQVISRPGKRGIARFKPDAAYFAGNATPATHRVSAPRITRTTAGRPVNIADQTYVINGVRTRFPSGDRDRVGLSAELAKREQWARDRRNLMLSAGDIEGPRGMWGEGMTDAYPSGITDAGTLRPMARYGDK